MRALDDVVQLNGKEFVYSGQHINGHLGVYYDSKTEYAHLLRVIHQGVQLQYTYICSTPLNDRERKFAQSLVHGRYQPKKQRR